MANASVVKAQGAAPVATPKAQPKNLSPDEVLAELRKMLEAEVTAATDKNGKIDHNALGPIFHDAIEDKKGGWLAGKKSPSKDELIAGTLAMAEAQLAAKNTSKPGEVSPTEVKNVTKSQRSVGEYLAAAIVSAGGSPIRGVSPAAAVSEAGRAKPVSSTNILASLKTQIDADAKAGKGELFDEARYELGKKGIAKPTQAQLSEQAYELVARRMPKGDVSADQIAALGAKDKHLAPYLDSAYVSAGGTKTALNAAVKALQAPVTPVVEDKVETKRTSRSKTQEQHDTDEVTDTQKKISTRAKKNKDALGFETAETKAIPATVTKVIDAGGELISGDSALKIFAQGKKDGVDPGVMLDHVMDPNGTVASKLTPEALMVVQQQLRGMIPKDGATPEEGVKFNERAENFRKLVNFHTASTDLSVDPGFQLRLVAKKDGRISPKEQEELLDEGLMAATAAARKANGGKSPTVDQVLAKYEEMGGAQAEAAEAQAADQKKAAEELAEARAATKVTPELNAAIDQLVESMGIQPGSFISGQQVDEIIARAERVGISPEMIADHLIETSQPAAAGAGGPPQPGVPPQGGSFSKLGSGMTQDGINRLMTHLGTKKATNEDEALAMQQRSGGLQALCRSLPSFDIMSLMGQQGNPQQLEALSGLARQQSSMMHQTDMLQIMQSGMGFGGLFGAMAAGGFPGMMDRTSMAGEATALAGGAGYLTGNVGFDLARSIGNYPPFSPTEMAMLSQIQDPQQRAMQMLQMFMQKQSMMATMLTNLAQMRHDMLKAVAQNFRA